MEIRLEGSEKLRLSSGENALGNSEGYRISKARFLKEHYFQINFCSVGCVVNVGCMSFAFHDNQQMLKELAEYVNNPHEAKERWEKIFNEQ